MTIDQLTSALLSYKGFLQSEFRNEGFNPIPFEVEYLEEGDAAKQSYFANGGLL